MSDDYSQGQDNSLPSFDDDPIGHLLHKTNRLDSIAREYAAERQMSEQREQLGSAVADLSREYSRQAPDYEDAVKFGIRKQLEVYERAGLTRHQAQRQLDQELESLTIRELQSGRNPAEKIYQIAHSLGYGQREAEPRERRRRFQI